MNCKIIFSALAILGMSVAHATDLTFTWSSADVTAHGFLVATDDGGGIYTATSGYIDVTQDLTGTVSGMYSLMPPVSQTPGIWYYGDNMVAPGQSPEFPGNGLLFGSLSGSIINIFYTAPAYYFQAGTATGVASGPLGGTNGEAGTFAAVPEPCSMVALGLGTLALVRRRKAV